MTATSDRVRAVAGLAICVLPLVFVVCSTVLWWDLVTGEISTQWSAGEASTSAPAWTALIMPFSGTLICAVIAAATALDGVGGDLRWAYFWTGGLGAMFAACWAGIMLPNLLDAANPAMPGWLVLAPLAILVGFLPWAVAGRGGAAAQDTQGVAAEAGATPSA